MCKFTLESPVTVESRTMHKQKLLKIGDLASLSGVPIKTIRHYSDIGVLPPTATTGSGFRLYSDADRARLELIRVLREVGFSLDTIRRLLANDISATITLESQIEALDEQLNQTRRQRDVIRAALNSGGDHALAHLARARVIAKLDAKGRIRFLESQLSRVLQNAPGENAWRESIYREAIDGHRTHLNGPQAEAWTELAHLLLDKEFLKRFNILVSQYWHDRDDYDTYSGWRQYEDETLALASTIVRSGSTPSDIRSQTLIYQFVKTNETIMRRKNDPSLTHELIMLIEKGMDHRLNRFWELIGLVKGYAPSTVWSRYQIHCWLHRGLKYWKHG
jgi:DNA-binding transcriptional MerR regulator